jgi:hypothetical protein
VWLVPEAAWHLAPRSHEQMPIAFWREFRVELRAEKLQIFTCISIM